MPGGNGTGPLGMGPMTGRAAGYCAGYPMPGYANPIPGKGRGFGFGLIEWIHVAGMVFIYMVLAVIVPCCMSDIIFPLLLTNRVED